MTDTDEMEISLLDNFEDCPSQDAQTSLAGGIPCDGDPEMTGSCSPPHPSKRKAKTQSSGLPERRPKKKVKLKVWRSPLANVSEKLPMPKVDLKARLDHHFRKEEEWCRKYKTPPELKETTERWSPILRPRIRISRKEKRRRYYERGFRFPFAERFYRRKYITYKMEWLCEHAAMKGFFKYIEELKYEHHLKKSLTELNAGEDLENECLESRKYKYLDDEGSLSPIEETEDDQNENAGDKEDIGARIVENSCFILSSSIPKKKKSKKTETLKITKNDLQILLRGIQNSAT